MEPQRKKLLSTSRPPILRDIETVRYETIQTSSTLPIRDDRSLIFEIPAQKGFYVDMSMIKMHTFFRIKRGNATNTAGADKVLAQSGILYTMFKDLQVDFNNRTVFWGRFLYPYYANLLLNFKIPGNERKQLYSTVKMYNDNSDLLPIREKQQVDKEGGGKEDKWVLTGYDGADIVDEWGTRVAETQRSNQLEVMGNVLFDLAYQDRLLRDDISLKLTFTPHSPSFCLMAGKLDPGFMLEITKSYIQVPRISVRPSAGLPSGDITYYFVDHRMMSIPVSQDTQNFSRTIVSGPIPRRLILTQISEEGFEGSYTKSCFSFPSFDMDSIQATAGAIRVPVDPLTANWTKEDVMAAYTSFCTNMKNSLGFSGMPFTKAEFATDRVHFAFDLTRDMAAGSPHWTPGESGNLALNIHWRNPLPHNIVLVICLEYEAQCKIDQFGQAQIDYAPVY